MIAAILDLQTWLVLLVMLNCMKFGNDVPVWGMRRSSSTTLAQVLGPNHAALCQTVDPLSGMLTGRMHASSMLGPIQSRLHKRADGVLLSHERRRRLPPRLRQLCWTAPLRSWVLTRNNARVTAMSMPIA